MDLSFDPRLDSDRAIKDFIRRLEAELTEHGYRLDELKVSRPLAARDLLDSLRVA